MSVTDPSVDPAQPDQGQGEEPAATPGGDAPYADYLNRIPEEVRGDVEPIFKEWDGQVTKRFQDAAEYRNQWKPYEELGVNQQNPEEVQWALQMLDAAKNNPHGVAQWYQDYAQQHGLTPQEQQQLDDQEFVDPSVQSLVDQRLQEQLGPVSQQLESLTGWQQQQQQAFAEQQAMQRVQHVWDGMKEKHGADFNEPMVTKFLASHVTPGVDPQVAIEAAFQDWQQVRNDIEKQALQSKADTPPGAESGGVADGSPEKIDSLAHAREVALAQLRGNNRA